jgi:hypothetical protein
LSSTTVIFRSGSREQAHLLCQALVEHGITARVIDEMYHEGVPGSTQVLVFEHQAEEASPIVEDFLANWVSVDPDAELEDEHSLEDHDGRTHMSWRACRQCGAPRPIICPSCGEQEKSFPLADPSPRRAGADSPDLPPVLHLQCTICDEIFQPHDAGVCQHCGHTFEHSLPGNDETPPFSAPPDNTPWQLPQLLLLIILALCLGILALYLYGDPNWPRLPPL